MRHSVGTRNHLPYTLGGMIAATLRDLGFREVHFARNMWIAALVGGLGLALAVSILLLAGFQLLLFVILVWLSAALAAATPTLLRSFRFRGPDDFRFRLRLIRRPESVELELVPHGADLSVADASVPIEDLWTPGRTGGRWGRPHWLAAMAALLAEGFQRVREAPLAERLDPEPVGRLRAAALFGHAAKRLGARGWNVRCRLPVLPLPWGVQLVVMLGLVVLVRRLLIGSPDGFGEELIGRLVEAALLSPFLVYCRLAQEVRARAEGADGKLSDRLEEGAYELCFETEAERVVRLDPEEVLGADFDLRRPDRLDEAIDGLPALEGSVV